MADIKTHSLRLAMINRFISLRSAAAFLLLALLVFHFRFSARYRLRTNYDDILSSLGQEMLVYGQTGHAVLVGVLRRKRRLPSEIRLLLVRTVVLLTIKKFYFVFVCELRDFRCPRARERLLLCVHKMCNSTTLAWFVSVAKVLRNPEYNNYSTSDPE